MLDKVSRDVRSLLKGGALQEFVKKIWIYQKSIVVVEMVYRGINFSFDITPMSSSFVKLDLVQRRPHLGSFLTPSGNRKTRIASGVTVDSAIAALKEAARSTFRTIDAHIDSTEDRPSVRKHQVSAYERRTRRVGVLTLPLNRNFGGNLQAFALLQALRKLGHDPILLNRQHPPKDAPPPPLGDLQLPGPTASSYGMDERSPNAAFIDKYLTPTTPRTYSSAHLASVVESLALDAVVVGSDQVWRAKYARTILPDFYLGFLPRHSEILRISYAASFGADKIAYGEQLPHVIRSLHEFDAISVREDTAVGICRDQLRAHAEHVLDPTLLLDPSDYVRLFPTDIATPPGSVLCYVLDADEDKAHVVHETARRLGVAPYGTNGLPFQPEGALRAGDGHRTVEHWLASFHRASFVITDSFHGVVFSILFNRHFIAYGNPKRGMARFESLLRMFGLESRLVVNAAEADLSALLAPIDWAEVNDRLAGLRARSLDFLDSALQQERHHGGEAKVTRQSRDVVVRDPLSGNPLRVLCTGCGACVSEAKGTLEMGWNEDGFLMPKAVGGEIPEAARRVCPFNPSPDPAVGDEDAIAQQFLRDAPSYHPAAGRYVGSYVAYSHRYRETSSSGGIATYTLERLLNDGVVDHLFIVQTDGTGGYRYHLCSGVEDLRSVSKTRYYPVSMHELFEIIDGLEGRIAISGVACFVKAIRLKQHYYPQYREKIPFVVGIICGGLKSRHYTDFLAQSASIKGRYLEPDYRVKDPNSTASDYSFSARDENDVVHQIKMRRIGNNWGAGLFKARACDFCSDVLTELADISLGDAWLPDYRPDGLGHNVVITRSSIADRIIREGIESGELSADVVSIETVVDSQAGGFNHKHRGLKFRAWIAEHFFQIPLPRLRSRLLTSISISEAIVQVHRERTRSKSHYVWNETSSSKEFRNRMRASRLALKAATSARKDGSNAPLVHALLHSKDLSPATAQPRSKHSLLRLLRQKARKDPFLIGLLRAALLGESPVQRDRSPGS
jgi:coenzyme F420-reducing hydrogenase beta subunit